VISHLITFAIILKSTKKYFTKKILFFLLAVVPLFIFSCSSGNSNVQDTDGADSLKKFVAAYDNSLAKGKVSDSIVCKNQPDLSYALYLPSTYTSSKPFPCIYFFDAHARGALPLNNYKVLAEKYGFVMIGYNNSKNGMNWQTNHANIKKMMDDTRARINIDTRQVYTSGFSGGSRIAGSVAIEDGGVAGVIGCAAGLPQAENGIHNKFDYFGIVGDYDFNLTEMEQLDVALEQNKFTHHLLVSAGIHGWPTASDFETALLWMQAGAMKDKRQPKNDALINALKSDYESRIKDAKTAGNLLAGLQLLDGAISKLDGVADINELKKQFALLASGPAYTIAANKQAALQKEELSQQQQLVRQFTQMNAEWWAKKIAEINQSIKKAGSSDEAKMYHRLLNYLGLAGYMQSSHALNTGDISHAEDYLKIFQLCDPQNPDVNYLSAICYMKKGDAAQAISELNDAASKGYSEVATLVTEPALGGLMDNADFRKIVERVRANGVAK